LPPSEEVPKDFELLVVNASKAWLQGIIPHTASFVK